MVDGVLSSLKNFKALMEFKAEHFDGYRQAQKTVLQKELCKKIKVLWQKSFKKLQMMPIKLT